MQVDREMAARTCFLLQIDLRKSLPLAKRNKIGIIKNTEKLQKGRSLWNMRSLCLVPDLPDWLRRRIRYRWVQEVSRR